jgi:ribosome recycling factor
MPTDYQEYSDKMKKTAEVLASQFAAVRAGRANAAVLEKIDVDYYGVPRHFIRSPLFPRPTRVRWYLSPGTSL